MMKVFHVINHFEEKLRIESGDYRDYDTVHGWGSVLCGVNNYTYEVSWFSLYTHSFVERLSLP